MSLAIVWFDLGGKEYVYYDGLLIININYTYKFVSYTVNVFEGLTAYTTTYKQSIFKLFLTLMEITLFSHCHCENILNT